MRPENLGVGLAGSAMSNDLGTSVERAEFYDQAAAEAEAQGATTFTDDSVFEATGRLVEVLTAKLREASHVRNGRPVKRRRIRL